MKTNKIVLSAIVIITILLAVLTCNTMKKSANTDSGKEYKIIFLHHSTGGMIYNSGNQLDRIIKKIFPEHSFVAQWFKDYNRLNGTNYRIVEKVFPQKEPYGWNNYPYDYYNIWVKNAGDKPYLNEPTLEILTKQYNLIIFKHCYPVSNILEDINRPDINSSDKRLENYKLQYIALKQKLNEFPDTKFIIWTGATQVESRTTEDQAIRANTFFNWVKNEWDTPNDNIYIWDFYELETEGTLYFKPEFALDSVNSHPNPAFAKRVSPIFCKRIIDVIEHSK